MKKFIAFFMALAIVISLAGILPVSVRADSPQIVSGYYGIDRQAGLMGQITPGTDAPTVLSRVLASGELKLSAGVTTGSVLTLSREGQAVEQLSLVVMSDCSGDGAFSVSDMLMVKSKLLGKASFTPAQAQAADVSGDNAVTITDFLQMKSKVLGLIGFAPRSLPNAVAENSRILTIGESCSFGPEDGILPPPATEPPVEETTEPSVEETAEPAAGETTAEEPSEDPTESTAEPPTEAPTEPPKIVTVEGDAVTWAAGKLTAVKLGTARLTYENESLIITVCQEGLKVSLPQQTLFVGPGAKVQLQTSINHPVAPGAVSYSVADTNVAKVDGQGILTGVATGTTRVTVTLPGGASATQEIHVIRLIDKLSLSKSSIKVKPGSTKQLSAAVSPAESPEKLIWTSSNTGIATVNDKGVVTGKANGTATITCTTEYGKVKASCNVKVCNLVQVALTFDDGPSSAYTNKLLDALKKYDINATFFLVGNRISTSPSSIKRMADEGHEIGYHTWAHTYFYNMSTATMQSDLAKFQDAVKAASGGKTATVFRAPGGGITDAALKTYQMPHIMWTIDTRDWETRNSWSVRNAIINGLKDGAIILLHDIHGTTVDGTISALDYIISQNMDVEFLTVTELLSRNGKTPENGVTYHRG